MYTKYVEDKNRMFCMMKHMKVVHTTTSKANKYLISI